MTKIVKCEVCGKKPSGGCAIYRVESKDGTHWRCEKHIHLSISK